MLGVRVQKQKKRKKKKDFIPKIIDLNSMPKKRIAPDSPLTAPTPYKAMSDFPRSAFIHSISKIVKMSTRGRVQTAQFVCRRTARVGIDTSGDGC